MTQRKEKSIVSALMSQMDEYKQALKQRDGEVDQLKLQIQNMQNEIYIGFN